MDDLLGMKRPGASRDTAIDAAVLDQILNIGDIGLRDALLDQLLADFNRIADALSGGQGDRIGAAAHELKGLAATIGAHRLAQLARRLDALADCAVASDLAEFQAPVQGEIRVVLDSLAMHAGRVRS